MPLAEDDAEVVRVPGEEHLSHHGPVEQGHGSFTEGGSVELKAADIHVALVASTAAMVHAADVGRVVHHVMVIVRGVVHGVVPGPGERGRIRG